MLASIRARLSYRRISHGMNFCGRMGFRGIVRGICRRPFRNRKRRLDRTTSMAILERWFSKRKPEGSLFGCVKIP
ncbi:hypothetical protein FOXYSP1_02649 [Fusarium oxysporum f. sp. phaseoli]